MFTKKISKSVNISIIILFTLLITACQNDESELYTSDHDLQFPSLSESWDEAIPLGNGMLGALIWKKGSNLRVSLDRADLWDLRPMEHIYDPSFTYHWVQEQWKNNNYAKVQEKGDRPYDQSAGPSKIPAAALEIPIEDWGPVRSVRLYTHEGICKIVWQNGIEIEIFVDANQPVGWIKITGDPPEVDLSLVPPSYNIDEDSGIDSPVTGQDLRRLGYPKGILSQNESTISYEQTGWEGFNYKVFLNRAYSNKDIKLTWSISSHSPDSAAVASASDLVENATRLGYNKSKQGHREWWQAYWDKASISIPDSILEKQWYLEQYKFGSAARKGAPPISLQAIWTADNGRLPPWKGDFHHDLNTQLSYWPAYSGNHLDLEEGFLDWLWSIREEGKKYTQWYYQTEGLNIPGVTTLTGQPMGGWIQYSLGPTVSAWLGQHFYLHWQFSMDKTFLKEKAYPWIKDVAIFLEQISEFDETGKRKLPLSSSPEIFNNSRDAWFDKTTNFDLALIKFTYQKAAELAAILRLDEDAEKWEGILSEWPEFDIDPDQGLTFAPGVPYDESHRHFSHLMAYHPLNLIDWSFGESDRNIILNTLFSLEKHGTAHWVGYSFSWLGNLYARAFMGNKAAETLKIFAENFTLKNSFHVNGDQSGKGYSNFTYRPFTLEGNFAFAAGLQEMLLQSHSGIIRVFPAIPSDWEDASFKTLRTAGAFLISSTLSEGIVKEVTILSEMGEDLKLFNPFNEAGFQVEGIHEDRVHIEENIIVIHTEPGEEITLKVL